MDIKNAINTSDRLFRLNLWRQRLFYHEIMKAKPVLG